MITRDRPAVRPRRHRCDSSPSEIVRPAHVLAAIAFFLVVLADTGRVPVETHSGTLEFGMIDEARTLEHSGAAVRALEVGVGDEAADPLHDPHRRLRRPVGTGGDRRPESMSLRSRRCSARPSSLGCVFAVIDNSFSKLRLFKITEFLAAAFLFAVLAVLVFYTRRRLMATPLRPPSLDR